MDECKPGGCLCFFFASNRSEPGFPCKYYNMRIAPKGVSSAKGLVACGFRLAGTMLAVNTSDAMTSNGQTLRSTKR